MEITGGVETLTVTGASPGSKLQVRRADGTEVVTLVADHAGNAHLAYVPDQPRVMASPEDLTDAIAHGWTLEPGDYSVDGEPVRVLVAWATSPTRRCTTRSSPRGSAT